MRGKKWGMPGAGGARDGRGRHGDMGEMGLREPIKSTFFIEKASKKQAVFRILTTIQ